MSTGPSTTATPKGVHLSLHYSEHYYSQYGNASADGVSSRTLRVTLVGPDVPEVFDATEDAPAVHLVVRRGGIGSSPIVHLGPDVESSAAALTALPVGSRIVHLEPLEGPVGSCMFGGTFASGDGRFNEAVRAALGTEFYGAIALHDRAEQ